MEESRPAFDDGPREASRLSRFLPSKRSRRLLMVWLLAMVELLTLAAAAILLLWQPAVFKMYYPRLASAAPYKIQDAQAVVEWMKTERPAVDLSKILTYGTFIPKEINHFHDVRDLVDSLSICLGVLVILMILIAVVAKPSALEWKAAQNRALFIAAIAGASALAFALWDWKVFFYWAHYPLFGPTSWKFPRSAYSLQLFPNSFWQSAGILCGILTLAPIAIARAALRWKKEKPAPSDTTPNSLAQER